MISITGIIAFMLLSIGAIPPMQPQQQDAEAPIRQEQVKMYESYLREQGLIENDCGRIKRSMSSSEQGQQYLGCVMERQQRLLVAWNSGNRAFMEMTREQVRGIMLAQVPETPTTNTQRAMFANAAGYLHKRLATWHQQLATLDEKLFKGQFIVESAARELVADVQTNMGKCTQRAREFVAAIQAEGEISAERLKEMVNAYIDEMFAGTNELVEGFYGKMNTDFNRLQRQIPTDFGLRGEQFREVVDLYERIVLNSLAAFKEQSLALWVTVPVPGSN